MSTHHLTAIIEREGEGYVALCPELDTASQGDTIEEAKASLKGALELFFETASAEEVRSRLRGYPPTPSSFAALSCVILR